MITYYYYNLSCWDKKGTFSCFQEKNAGMDLETLKEINGFNKAFYFLSSSIFFFIKIRVFLLFKSVNQTWYNHFMLERSSFLKWSELRTRHEEKKRTREIKKSQEIVRQYPVYIRINKENLIIFFLNKSKQNFNFERLKY